MSERPWAENAYPTAEELADWYAAAPREERVRLAEQFIANAERASACFLMDHEGLGDELSWQRRRAAKYRTAWLSARRRVHPSNFLRGYHKAISEQNARILQHEAETPWRGHDEDGACCRIAKYGAEQ